MPRTAQNCPELLLSGPRTKSGHCLVPSGEMCIAEGLSTANPFHACLMHALYGYVEAVF